jgi:adenylylsulfate kinase
MKKKILVMGLPGSGKTTLSKKLSSLLDAVWLNADIVRKKANDWDFSFEGRLRQSKRMKDLSEKYLLNGKHVIADFVCPTEETRKDFNPDIIIYMDTIKEGRFDDTNKMFVPPKNFDFIVKEKNAEVEIKKFFKKINKLLI